VRAGWVRPLTGGTLLIAVLTSCTPSGHATDPPGDVISTPLVRVTASPAGAYVIPAGIHKIKHVIIVMQENRSFDSYFGTFPGADGIPMRRGVPTVCVPAPGGKCVRPYHETADVNGGGPHALPNAVADVAGGRMNGFIRQRDLAVSTCQVAFDPACSPNGTPDVMGYHTAAEIPNYWKYA
jgi:phospholipase C